MPLKEENTVISIDRILNILQNPNRRRIIQRLSQEPDYSFQMARDMGLSQQQVSKHLAIMEEAGVLSSTDKASVLGGPSKKNYMLENSFSLTIDVAPHLYKEKIISFDEKPGKKISVGLDSITKRIGAIAGSLESDSISPLAEILGDIDSEIDRLERERSAFLWIRNSVMKEASRIFKNIDGADARRIIHSALDKHETSVEEISKSLNLREDDVSEIIYRIKKTLKTDYV